MTYKSGVSLFRSRYDRESRTRKNPMPTMTDAEILFELSVVQQQLADTHRLSQKTQTLDLIDSQYKYVVGTNSNNISADILDIDCIIPSPPITTETETTTDGGDGYGYGYGLDYGGGSGVTVTTTSLTTGSVVSVCQYPTFLRKASLGDIGNMERISGLPTRYAFYDDDSNSALWINSLPAGFDADTTMQLFIIYNQRMYLFDEWTDYDPTDSDYGGSFKLPRQFHSLIVEGALANIFPEKMNTYLLKSQQMIRSKPISVSGKLTYKLGIG